MAIHKANEDAQGKHSAPEKKEPPRRESAKSARAGAGRRAPEDEARRRAKREAPGETERPARKKKPAPRAEDEPRRPARRKAAAPQKKGAPAEAERRPARRRAAEKGAEAERRKARGKAAEKGAEAEHRKAAEKGAEGEQRRKAAAPQKKAAPAEAERRPARRRAAEKPARQRRPESAQRRRRAQDHFEDFLETAPESAPKHRSRRQLERERAMRRTATVVISLVLALLCGALYAGSCVSSSDTMLPNVYLDGIAIGGLTKEETAAALSAQGWEQDAQRPLTVELPAGVRLEIDRQKAGSALPVQKAVNAAFAYGHSGAWLRDLASWLRSYSSGVNLGNFAVTLNDTYLDSVLRDGLSAFAEATAVSEPYVVDKENECLVMRKGAGTVTLDGGKLSAAVREALLSKQETLRYEELEGLPETPDFEAIYQALAVEPRDASFTEDWEILDEVVGCTFGVEQAVSVWEATPWLEEARIPLTITWPETTGEMLRARLFRDKLGEQTSYFPNSIQNRISNIQLAASKLDGLVLKPGEIFSYNETLGERTLDNGYLLAGAYSNGEVVEEVGGGICQVSSTLYCAVLYSQLGLRSRDSHYFKVDYLPWGQDATVSWPKPDFKFENTRDYPIRIHAVADPVGRSITVEIWGTDNIGTHIELFDDRYTVYDDTWGVAIGWNVYLYARVYDADGNLLETRELPVSTYHKHDEDIEWPAAKYEAEAETIQIG